MQVIHTIAQLRQWRQGVERVAFVPTMGNLHEGHLTLVREARKRADTVVVSVFVNRLQFVQGEDYEQYPRTLASDSDKLIKEGVDVLFAPTESELYPAGQQQYQVMPSDLQNELCGQFRSGHFVGVATVVTKLFNIVKPDVACFGKKDYQQLAIIQAMVRELNMDIQIVPVEICRAEDGLALSSRNAYLSTQERRQVPQLYAQLRQMVQAIQQGNRQYQYLEDEAVKQLSALGWQVDYVSIRHVCTLKPAQIQDKDLVILVAARLGTTRLIDNVEVYI
ncbi:pantoate--beta-alanine ligase [Neisseriaceae bacterium ESL0693]|nr:pantoate--beta-alanine ligase [Neisseriaceae bacterium ESL0693]